MKTKLARRRYTRTAAISMGLYIITLLGVVLLRKNDVISGPALFALSIIPGLAVMWFMRGHYQFLQECDELERKIHTDSLLISLFLTLSISTVIGLIEELSGALHVGIFWMFPAFYVVYAGVSIIKSRQYGVKCLP